jgi:hypothetical protein
MKKKLLVFAALLVLVLACASVAMAAPIEVADHGFVDRGQLDEIAKVGGHTVPLGTDWVIIKEPTCTEEGEAFFWCYEGDTSHEHYIRFKPLGHKWASQVQDEREWGNVKKPATCVEEGYAVDVCLRCTIENPDVTRTIEKKPHEYNEKCYDVIEEPGCGEDGEGLGWKTCRFCGERMPKQDDNSHLVILPKIPHVWTDWRVDWDSDCDDYGACARTCIRCGALQHLDEDHPVIDQFVEITIDKVLPLKNPKWNTSLNNKLYTEYQALDADLAAQGFEWEIKKNWLADCYTRLITYTCPYCHGESDKHDDFTVKVVNPATIAHIWRELPDPDDSVAPTCTEDGYDVYYCIYDEVGPAHGHEKEDQKKVVKLPATGHNFSEWYPSELFTKDGKTYLVSYRYCNKCGAHEQKTEEYTEPVIKQGLVHDEDGVWRYYINGEVAVDFTNIVVYQGGEFWVVNGVVPNAANGMVICPDGKAYFLAQGQIQRVTQWAEYNGEWFVLINGELAKATGLMPYDGSWFAVESGRKLHVNGLWQDPNTGVWTYMADGQLQDYTGTVTYDGATFNVVHGYLAD